jgi:hypothetical protein
LRIEITDLKRRLHPQQKHLKEVKDEIRSLKLETKQAWVAWRNNYARPAIQAQFADGIRE